VSIAFKKGIFIGLAIYGVGMILTFIIHLIYGWEYPHGPPVSIIPIFVTLAVGTIRLLTTAHHVFMHNSSLAKGELVIHAFVFLVVVLLVQWMKYP
jgi:hypothetical protein